MLETPRETIKKLVIISRKPAGEAVGQLDDEGVKGLLKEDREIAEKLNV